MTNPHRSELPDLRDYDGVLFDLDGVLTPTAELHMQAWAQMFSELLAQHPEAAPYTDEDYFVHLDGRRRSDGVAALLESRGISWPLGSPDDEASADTVHGVGNRKNVVFAQLLSDGGIDAYPGSRALVEHLSAAGVPLGVVSSSKNAATVLAAAGLSSYFAVVVDGLRAEQDDLASKPAPDMFALGAELLGVSVGSAAAIEDAVSGVASAASAGIAMVVGVDRGTGRERLTSAGATLVVDDLDVLAEVAS